MAFSASAISKNIDLGDGRKFIIEIHTAPDRDYELRYEASSDVDVDAKLAEHATSLWQQLVDAELGEVLNG